jgi:hypothetical protein
MLTYSEYDNAQAGERVPGRVSTAELHKVTQRLEAFIKRHVVSAYSK